MEENLAAILKESNRIMNKLQVLSAFFEDEVLYKIYLRSQVIHSLFAHNPELDANKLELFHVQFTETLIGLLKEIKKANEKKVTILFDEIQLNDDLIAQVKSSAFSEERFHSEKQRQALRINNSLRKLYQVLSEDSQENPFAKNMHTFSARFAEEFYDPIEPEMLDALTRYDQKEVYANAYAIIGRKLMGALCKYDFKTEFFNGLKAGDVLLELYKFVNNDRYFVYLPSRNLFLFCDVSQITHIDWTDNRSKKERIAQELQQKNEQIESRISAIKTYIPPQIRQLLAENYKKISDIDFLQNMSNFEIQANILKTMLNTLTL
ncbi:hypothetical protein [Hufsiella ginkgonis]|uniref:Uncharacterized protein n=1 Tax=Hufsiella ginkgonis TaxID=2695274 RepID=A0A7K1XVX3_9SPHI|nr:hypothetical protein [Hufsiella ginkgonis]MXV14977.1 hypothetical protein [Hufsiella ginkgonis]